MTFAKLIKKALVAIIIAYTTLVATVFFMQEQMIYHPTPPIGLPADYGLKNFEQVNITTSDNYKLVAWFHKPATARKALIYFYGNADSLQSYPQFLKKFADHGYMVLAINYRGYGGSEGKPSEKGLYNDGRAAINFVSEYIKSENIIVVGRSMGTGVTVQMATEFNLNAIVLISPYTSITDIAERLYPYLPIRLISTNRFDSLKKISNIAEPVLFIHGDLDNFIPLSNAQTLFDATKSRKALNIYKGGNHVQLDKSRIADDIFKFVDGQMKDSNADK